MQVSFHSFTKSNMARMLAVLIFCFGSVVFIGAGFNDSDEKLISEIGDVFGLEHGELVRLDIDTTPGQFVTAEIEIENEKYLLELAPYSLRTDEFTLQVQLADGSYELRDPGISRNVKGFLQGVEGSRVVGSVLENGLAAKIVLGNGSVYFVEPLNSRLDVEIAENVHVLYRQSDTSPHECSCGLEHKINDDQILVASDQFDKNKGGSKDGGGNISVAELAVDADFEFFTDYVTEQATLDRMELIVGIVNDQYEMDVEITHVISGAIVRTAEPDPYSATGAFALLQEFRSHWLNNQGGIQRDVAHLFTGKEIDGGTIGIAWDIGAICNSSAYCLSQVDFNNNLACATDLTAHELGHLWNGSHCNCTSHTMNPFITC